MKVLTFSRFFPKKHPKEGQPTYFVESILASINKGLSYDELSALITPAMKPFINDFVLVIDNGKGHTIRAGNRFKVGDMASLRVWSDKPYRSKQVEFAQVEVKKVWKFELRPIKNNGEVEIFGFINDELITEELAKDVARNDGLAIEDFNKWFCPDGTKFILSLPIFTGQIICWDETINYSPLTPPTNEQ